MSARTKTPRTDAVCTLAFVGPTEHAQAARDALYALGFEEARDTVPWRECFPEWSDAQLPGITLAGARHKEGLTQVQLARLTGIPQRHLSEMEHGKRPIGKERAKKLAEVLKVNYHILL
jgi:DNA-binding XRE family transcriptional regulator